MKAFNKRTVFVIALLAALSAGGFLLFSRASYSTGFPLDDAWIHQTYARNLARGAGWSFYPGEPSAGLTAPLWALLLAPAYLFDAAPFAWTFALGWLILTGIGVVGIWGWSALTQAAGRWKLAAGILLVSEWHLVWAAVSGMETLLFGLCVLTCLVWLLYLADRSNQPNPRGWLGLGLLIGASAWIRPEGLTLLGPAGFVLLLNRQDKWQERLKGAGFVVVGWLALFLPYLGFNRWLAGAWWPNTFYAKQAEYALYLEDPISTRLLGEFLPMLSGVGVLLLPGFLYLFARSFQRKQWGIAAGGIWVLGHLSLYAMRLPVIYQHGRYVIPVMAVYFLWGLAGTSQLIGTGTANRLWWVGSRVWGLSIALVTFTFWGMGATAYADDVAFINSEMVFTAEWVAANTPSDAVIAAHDIGALGFFAERRLLDLAGLVSPDVIPFIRDETRLAEFLNRKQPGYLVTFPGWYPQLVNQAELLFETGGKISPELGGENMAVYRWPGE